MRRRPAEYWTDLFRMHGHTGWQIPWVYWYDQPLRLRGVYRTLSHVGVDLRGLKVLDVGCGVGDLVRRFAEAGATVTGLDISEDMIRSARKGIGERNANITLLAGSIEEMGFPPASFDLATSITVLQHIVERDRYEQAVQNIVDVVRPGGHIVIAESAPITVTERSLEQTTVRPRRDWIEAFEGRGCSLVYERGHPSLGISSLLLLQRWIRGLLHRVRPPRSPISQQAHGIAQEGAQGPPLASAVYSWFARGVLYLFYPFEHWLFLAPPRKHAVLVYMVFRKGAA